MKKMSSANETLRPSIDEVAVLFPRNRQEWREWLAKHHATTQSIWLLYHKKNSAGSGVSYREAVEEALCYGWIDSRAKPVDEQCYKQFFTPRKAKSGWSRVNKERVAQLIATGQMMPAGAAVINAAKADGSWSSLDDIENLVVPADLGKAFRKAPKAQHFFTGLARSVKRASLLWLASAKKAGTREKRVLLIVELCTRGIKPLPTTAGN